MDNATATQLINTINNGNSFAILSITIALGALCISLVAQGYALYLKEEKRKTLGQLFILMAFIFFGLFVVWTIANTIELWIKLILVSIVGIAVIYGIIIWICNRTDSSNKPVPPENPDLAKELLVIGIDKTNLSNKNVDLVKTAKQIAQAYKSIRDIINS